MGQCLRRKGQHPCSPAHSPPSLRVETGEYVQQDSSRALRTWALELVLILCCLRDPDPPLPLLQNGSPRTTAPVSRVTVRMCYSTEGTLKRPKCLLSLLRSLSWSASSLGTVCFQRARKAGRAQALAHFVKREDRKEEVRRWDRRQLWLGGRGHSAWQHSKSTHHRALQALRWKVGRALGGGEGWAAAAGAGQGAAGPAQRTRRQGRGQLTYTCAQTPGPAAAGRPTGGWRRRTRRRARPCTPCHTPPRSRLSPGSCGRSSTRHRTPARHTGNPWGRLLSVQGGYHHAEPRGTWRLTQSTGDPGQWEGSGDKDPRGPPTCRHPHTPAHKAAPCPTDTHLIHFHAWHFTRARAPPSLGSFCPNPPPCTSLSRALP